MYLIVKLKYSMGKTPQIRSVRKNISKTFKQNFDIDDKCILTDVVKDY